MRRAGPHLACGAKETLQCQGPRAAPCEAPPPPSCDRLPVTLHPSTCKLRTATPTNGRPQRRRRFGGRDKGGEGGSSKGGCRAGADLLVPQLSDQGKAKGDGHVGPQEVSLGPHVGHHLRATTGSQDDARAGAQHAWSRPVCPPAEGEGAARAGGEPSPITRKKPTSKQATLALTSAHLLIIASPWRCTSLAQASSRMGYFQISSAPFWDCGWRTSKEQWGGEHRRGWHAARCALQVLPASMSHPLACQATPSSVSGSSLVSTCRASRTSAGPSATHQLEVVPKQLHPAALVQPGAALGEIPRLAALQQHLRSGLAAHHGGVDALACRGGMRGGMQDWLVQSSSTL